MTTATSSDALYLRAAAFIREHAGAHLDRNQLIERTRAALRPAAACSDHTLNRVIVRALTEHEGCATRAWIDVDATTRSHVQVRDPEHGVTYVFAAADLAHAVQWPYRVPHLRLLDEAPRRAATGAPVDGSAP